MVRINDVPPGLANARGPGESGEREEAQYMRGEFCGE